MVNNSSPARTWLFRSGTTTMIRAVFFDMGNTLIYPYPSVGEIYREIALKHGMEIDAAAVNASFGRALSNRSAIPLNDTKSEKKWWKDLVREIISSLCRTKHFNAFFQMVFQYMLKLIIGYSIKICTYD